MASNNTSGVVPATNWNNVKDMTAGQTVTIGPGTVVDSNGLVAPGMSASFTGGTTLAGVNTVDFLASASNDNLLFNGAYVQSTGTGVFIPGTGTPSTVVVKNIPYANYDVYVYVADSGAGSAADIQYQNSSFFARGGLNLASHTSSNYAISTTILNTGASNPQANTVHLANLHGDLVLNLQAVTAGANSPVMYFSGLQIVSTPAPAFTEIPTDVYQYAVPMVPLQSEYSVTVQADPQNFAYMWLPSNASYIRGLLVGPQNLLERRMFGDQNLRSALASAGLGIVWINPATLTMDLFGSPGVGPQPVSGNQFNQAGVELVRVLNALAAVSGYPEIASAPIALTSHSAATPFTWAPGIFATPALAGRVFALLPDKGWFPTECPSNIPIFKIASEWTEIAPGGENWTTEVTTSQGLLAQSQNCLLGMYEDVGAGHFRWNEAAVGPIAQFIVSAANAYTGSNILNSSKYALGYVIPYSQLGSANTTPVAASQYAGGVGTAYWYPDLATATAVNSRMAAELAKLPQMVDVPLNGNSELTATFPVPEFWSGPVFGSDNTTKIIGDFLSQSPSPSLFPNQTLSHSSNPIQYSVSGTGGARQVTPDSFKLWVDRGSILAQGFAPASAVIMAYQPGDSQYRSADRPVNIVSNLVNTGLSQTISFNSIPAQSVMSMQPIQVQASATSGLPVQSWVIAGPYTITDQGVLMPEPLPLKTSFPMTVTVAGYQKGGTDGTTAWASAGPVFTSFVILGPNIITFPLIPTQAVGTSFKLSATASSGLPVTFASSNTSICSISGGTVSLLRTGPCYITATQAGNGGYTPASSVTNSFQVVSSSQTITFKPVGSQMVGTSFKLNATASSGLAVTLTSSNTSICSISGSTVSLLRTGPCYVTASQAGNGIYAPANSVINWFAVTPLSQTVTYPPIGSQVVGTSFMLSATASSGLPVTFASSNTSICSVSGSTVSLLRTGPCYITASQAGNGIYAPANSVINWFAVTPH